jgi:hypothetical protein
MLSGRRISQLRPACREPARLAAQGDSEGKFAVRGAGSLLETTVSAGDFYLADRITQEALNVFVDYPSGGRVFARAELQPGTFLRGGGIYVDELGRRLSPNVPYSTAPDAGRLANSVIRINHSP